jgi:plasmid stabilization system protein ParE
MKVPVIISDRAANDIQHAYGCWAENRSAEQAARWYSGIIERIYGLADTSGRHPLAPEAAGLPFEAREMLFGLGRRPTHRVLFTAEPHAIYVLTIRHVSQGDTDPSELLE